MKGDIEMKKSKIISIIMIVSMLFFIATIGLTISMSKIDKQTENTTKFYTATVNSVDIVDTGGSVFAEIHTKEYDNSWHISTNISKNIKMDDVRNLRNGQTIYFRIENKKVEQINEVEFINITSLKTDTKNIFSLEDYNEYIRNSAYPAKTASIIVALLFLFIPIFCYFKTRKIKVHK